MPNKRASHVHLHTCGWPGPLWERIVKRAAATGTDPSKVIRGAVAEQMTKEKK